MHHFVMSESTEYVYIKFCADLKKMQAKTYEIIKTAFWEIATAFVKAIHNLELFSISQIK
jgi:hypothetical protein